MANENKPIHGVWGSRWVFILAAAGSAVGLGNIWKFPYMTGANGGAAFVMMYLLCIVAVGVPIMVAEVMLGRRGGMSPVNSMLRLARDNGVNSRWAGVGALGALSGFLLLSFYTVIGGWTLFYVWEMVSGALVHASATEVQGAFDGMMANVWLVLGGHTAFMAMTMFVVGCGVIHGIERAVRILMPLLFVLLAVLFGYALTSDGFDDAVRYMFAFDIAKLSGASVLAAVGHSFFTLSIGLGAIMAYGAYMPREVVTRSGQRKPVSIGSTVLAVAALDTLVALVAGMIIFPIVFANGLAPGEGPGLLFVTLPLAFAEMPLGMLFGTLFFVLVVCAAWTSSISIAEPPVAWLVEKGFSRPKAAILIGLLAWTLGIGSALSFNVLSDYTLFGKTFFGLMDFLTINIMLPVGGLLIAIFAGWIMKETQARKELAMKSFGLYMVWRAMVRVFAPLALMLVFAFSLWQALAPAGDAVPAEPVVDEAPVAPQAERPVEGDVPAAAGVPE
ncbi:SNF family Na(+)-dependent transporter [Alcanivorax sp. S71-1-4]|uniref:sodium-dependent transporter n=1 Tax=Alcanivorax sp. S71-1-4 TaxID=1177159 RepID=UPI00135731C6|nr:sodium-dependent transporter [Alcanivorax sp. S71-1-4]KAF0810056.1 SNF family Na(+)-dependent transporter [Alcanivorax sp. S71-1-4]